MKTISSNTISIILLTSIFYFCLPNYNYAQDHKIKFGGFTGLYFDDVKINGSSSEPSYGYFFAMRVTKPLIKKLEDFRLEFDLSLRNRNFDVKTESLQGIMSVSETKIQLDPILSKVFFVEKTWSPVFRGGFNVSCAIDRTWELKKPGQSKGENFESSGNSLFSASLVLGGGVTHNKSGFTSEITVTFKDKKPDSSASDSFSAEWNHFAFNIAIGFIFGGN